LDENKKVVISTDVNILTFMLSQGVGTMLLADGYRYEGTWINGSANGKRTGTPSPMVRVIAVNGKTA